MVETEINHFSGPVTVFQERRLPERGTPAGYSALIGAFDLQVPLPRTLSAIGERHRDHGGGGLATYRRRATRRTAHLDGHLTFALKYEGLDLAVLSRLFLAPARPAQSKRWSAPSQPAPMPGASGSSTSG